MLKLYKHQEQALKQMEGKQGFALLMDMGTGKSLTVLTHIFRNQLFPVLIVTKNSIKQNWIREIKQASGWMKYSGAVVLDGGTDKKRKTMKQGGKHFYIINYESLTLVRDDIIKVLKPRCVVLDESSSIKSPTAKCTKAAIKIGERAVYKYLLTGTPVTNNPLDIWSQMHFLDPRILFFTSFWAFKHHYAVLQERRAKGNTHTFKQVVGYRNMEEMLRRIKPYSFAIRKEQCLDLPEKIYQERMIEMTDEQKRIYKTLSEKLIAEVTEGEYVVAQNILTKMVRLHQICGGLVVTENAKVPVSERKTAEILTILDEIGKQRVVVWAKFRYEIQKLQIELEKKGYRVGAIWGDVEPDEREELNRRLNANDLDILICQPQTAGYGLNFHASYVIYYSCDWSLQNRQQSEDRNHGINRGIEGERTTYIDLITKGTLEIDIRRALALKKRFQDLFFDDSGLKAEELKSILKGGDDGGNQGSLFKG